MAFGVLFGDQAAEQVQLVLARHRNKKVGCIHTRLLLYIKTGSVSHKSHGVVPVGDLLHLLLRQVHHHQIVILHTETFCQAGADFSAANNNNLHMHSVLF